MYEKAVTFAHFISDFSLLYSVCWEKSVAFPKKLALKLLSIDFNEDGQKKMETNNCCNHLGGGVV